MGEGRRLWESNPRGAFPLGLDAAGGHSSKGGQISLSVHSAGPSGERPSKGAPSAVASPRPRPGLRVCSAADMPLPPSRAFLFFLLLFLLVTSAAALLPCFLLLVPLLLPPLPLPLFLSC